MKNYYINPATSDLIIFDSETQEATVLLRIEKVTVGEIHATDNGKRAGRSSGVRRCSNCGKVGHRKDSCPDK